MLHARESYNERVQDSAGKIPMDEPVFLLRGQDALAPAMLDIYVALSRNMKNADETIIRAVEEHADAMRTWHDKKRKIADMEISDSIY